MSTSIKATANLSIWLLRIVVILVSFITAMDGVHFYSMNILPNDSAVVSIPKFSTPHMELANCGFFMNIRMGSLSIQWPASHGGKI
jgi:hypothetical protein